MTFDEFYGRLEFLMGGIKPYTWAAGIGLKSTLANIDRYRHVPRQKTIRAIAEASGCSYDWLITGQGNAFTSPRKT